MQTFSRLIGKVGLTAGGVAVGLILAAGSGAAAIHYSKVAATEHSIVAQPVSARVSDDRGLTQRSGSDSPADLVDDRGLTERSGSDSPADLVDDRLLGEQAESPEPELGDDSRSGSSAAATVGAPLTVASDDSAHRSGGGAVEPGDDHGKDSGK